MLVRLSQAKYSNNLWFVFGFLHGSFLLIIVSTLKKNKNDLNALTVYKKALYEKVKFIISNLNKCMYGIVVSWNTVLGQRKIINFYSNFKGIIVFK